MNQQLIKKSVIQTFPRIVKPKETDDEIEFRLNRNFRILGLLTDSCISGDDRSMIVAGEAGLGKSYEVERKIANYDPNGHNTAIIRGYSRATGVIKKAFAYKEKGQVLVFDDCDNIFFDDTGLSIIKALCDTTENRRISWLSERPLIDEETQKAIPSHFDFNGSVIFITNQDFDGMVTARHRLAPHLEAMISRSHYLNLSMRTKREKLIRIRQVICQGLLKPMPVHMQIEVYEYIQDNVNILRELSLRMAIKIGSLRKNHPNNWKEMASVTCCRT